MKKLSWSLVVLAAAAMVVSASLAGEGGKRAGKVKVEKVVKSNAEWKEILTPEQFRILRQKGTERAFTGKYHDHQKDGVYRCAACGLELFSSDTKFDSGTGWPSYYQPVEPAHVETETDASLGVIRTEVHCARCGGHLGHVFPDGPKPTGLRYCINSAALEFEPADR
jgi:peptide-methionine (R)-S-oxide reductase